MKYRALPLIHCFALDKSDSIIASITLGIKVYDFVLIFAGWARLWRLGRILYAGCLLHVEVGCYVQSGLFAQEIQRVSVDLAADHVSHLPLHVAFRTFPCFLISGRRLAGLFKWQVQLILNLAFRCQIKVCIWLPIRKLGSINMMLKILLTPLSVCNVRLDTRASPFILRLFL